MNPWRSPAATTALFTPAPSEDSEDGRSISAVGGSVGAPPYREHDVNVDSKHGLLTAHLAVPEDDPMQFPTGFPYRNAAPSLAGAQTRCVEWWLQPTPYPTTEIDSEVWGSVGTVDKDARQPGYVAETTVDLGPYLRAENIWNLSELLLTGKKRCGIAVSMTRHMLADLTVLVGAQTVGHVHSPTTAAVKITAPTPELVWTWLLQHRWADVVTDTSPALPTFTRASPADLEAWTAANDWYTEQIDYITAGATTQAHPERVGGDDTEYEVWLHRYYLLGFAIGGQCMTYPRAVAYARAAVTEKEARRMEFGPTPPTAEDLATLTALR